jgi:endonuclease/exonuclease/phosphatase family metal-dependent hydrolase
VIVKLLSYNIRFGGREREAALAEVIRSVAPDVVVFQEATDPHVIERLGVATGLPIWAARRSHSIGYISRLAVDHHEWHYPAGAKHSFLEIALAGSQARIFGLHLSAMFSKWSERRRTREIQSLLKGIERYREGMHVLVGDFNTLAPGELLDVRRMPAWIRALIWLSGRDIQRDTIKLVAAAKYVDGYRRLLPEQFAQRLLSCEVINKTPAALTASDHFPLLAQLDFS